MLNKNSQSQIRNFSQNPQIQSYDAKILLEMAFLIQVHLHLNNGVEKICILKERVNSFTYIRMHTYHCLQKCAEIHES